MTHKTVRKGFTLIELLTVMAIITLLIGILTPALGAARDRARFTAVKAQINAMGVGLESFFGDEQKYIPSNPFYFARDPNSAGAATEIAAEWEVSTGGSGVLQGAHLLVDALVGRDFLGYDPKPTSTTATPPYDRWDAANDRRQPYIPADGVDVTSTDKPPEDGFGKVPVNGPNGTASQPTIGTTNPLLCRVFRDKFGWPILYYRANPSANQNTPIMQTMLSTGNNIGDGVYDGRDNEAFTSYDPCSVATLNLTHRICDANMDFTDSLTGWTSSGLPHRFAEFIRSIRSTTYKQPPNDKEILRPRPVKNDRFIILSAGKDGIYGTLDDAANFEALSTER